MDFSWDEQVFYSNRQRMKTTRLKINRWIFPGTNRFFIENIQNRRRMEKTRLMIDRWIFPGTNRFFIYTIKQIKWSRLYLRPKLYFRNSHKTKHLGCEGVLILQITYQPRMTSDHVWEAFSSIRPLSEEQQTVKPQTIQP